VNNLSLELFSKIPEPFQYPYCRIYWNGSCYLEDTVECKEVNIDIDVKQGWNSLIFEIIDVFDVFDPLDQSVIAQTDHDILDVKINGVNSWPVQRSNQKSLSKVKFHSDHMTWFSGRTASAIVQGKIKNHFQGKGLTEICFYFDGDQIIDHYYPGRSKISVHNYLNFDNIKEQSFSNNLFGLSNLRLKDQFTIQHQGVSTYEQHWGGLDFSINNDCDFKQHLPQWISMRPWPFKWIHAEYYDKYLPVELAREFFND